MVCPIKGPRKDFIEGRTKGSLDGLIMWNFMIHITDFRIEYTAQGCQEGEPEDFHEASGRLFGPRLQY